MHALLGLAASCLSFNSNVDYSSLAISHRLLAIKGVNEGLSSTSRTSDDGDALLAACYALTFQSSYLKDGISEFLIMVRGCALVSLQLQHENLDVSFSITPNDHFEFMEQRLEDLPSVDADLYEGSAASLKALLPLCEGIDAQQVFHTALQDCVEKVGIDSRQGICEIFFKLL
jgi:hypothetical protein